MTLLIETEEHGWTIRLRAGELSRACYVARRAKYGDPTRVYGVLSVFPDSREVTVRFLADAQMDLVPHALRIASNIARGEGFWEEAPWLRTIRKDGARVLRLDIGRAINIDEQFAQITEHVDLTSEVTL